MHKRTKRFIIGAISGLLLLAIVPFKTLVAPAIELRFVDESGNPVQAVAVEEICYHYTFSDSNLCLNESSQRITTDSAGTVRFPEKAVWFPLIYRIPKAALSYLLLLAHGSVGRDVYFIVIVPDGYKSNNFLKWEDSFDSPYTIIMKKNP